jgi:hypothetical protein
MSTTVVIEGLYQARAGKVDFVDVPELGFVLVKGTGTPLGGAFQQAIQALFSVSYSAHFAVRKASGEAPRVLPLEALWWVDDADPHSWQWQAMIAQLDPIDEDDIARAVEAARPKRLPALDRVRYERWREGLSAQTLHVGPYADEGPTIARLHDAIAAAGATPRGHHHEIYLGDPRRAAPARLRTVLRQPVTAPHGAP